MTDHWRKIAKCLLLSVILNGLWICKGQAQFMTQIEDNLFKEGDFSFMAGHYTDTDDTIYLVEGNLSIYGSLFSDGPDFRVTVRGVYDSESTGNEEGTRPYMTFDQVFQETTQPYADLREAFVNWRNASFKVKVGLQFIDWGQIDEWNVLDIANTEDFSLLSRLEKDRKIGIPAICVTNYFTTWDVQAFYSPTWIPYRIPGVDEKWFGIYARELSKITVPPEQLPSILRPLASNGLILPMILHTRNLESPEWFNDYQFGARVRKNIGNTMVGILYFQGFDWFPSFEANALLSLPRSLDMNDMMNQGIVDMVLFPVQRKIRMVGTEFSTTMSKLAVRGEAAYIKDRHYNKMYDPNALPEGIVDSNRIMRDFLEKYALYPDADIIYLPVEMPDLVKKTDEVQVGLQADYIFKDLVMTMACVYSHVFSPDPDLIVKENDLFTILGGYYTFSSVDITIRGGGGIHLVARDIIAMVSAERTWKDVVLTEVGMVSIDGPENSLLGLMGSSDQVYFKVSYCF